MKKTLFNFAAFQAGWFACIVGELWFAVISSICIMTIHAAFIMSTRKEWLVIAIITFIGITWDTLLTYAGILKFGQSSALTIPIWLVLLWILFATTFCHSFIWLHRRLLLASALAAIFGPATYFAGSHLSDANMAKPLLFSLAVMSLGWSTIFPVGLYLSRRIVFAEVS